MLPITDVDPTIQSALVTMQTALRSRGVRAVVDVI
jgi:hypothetical protein